MNKQSSSNHGEGNPEAAERFNTAERAFVDSARGKQKIAQGPGVKPEEEAELVSAENAAAKHAKEDDSQTDPMNSKHGV